MNTCAFPLLVAPQNALATIIPSHTAGVAEQEGYTSRLRDLWCISERPPGLVNGSCFVGVASDSMLLFFQWESLEAIRRLPDDSGKDHPLSFGGPNAPAYRLYRSLEGSSGDVRPSRLICAYFDTDGTERQHFLVDQLIELASDLPPIPSALSAHFFCSLDGTRVVNYTEWTSSHTHDREAVAGVYDEIYHVSTQTPGVRSLQGIEYELKARI